MRAKKAMLHPKPCSLYLHKAGIFCRSRTNLNLSLTIKDQSQSRGTLTMEHSKRTLPRHFFIIVYFVAEN